MPCDRCRQRVRTRVTINKAPTPRAFIPREWGLPEGTPLEDITYDVGGFVRLVCPEYVEYPRCMRCGTPVLIAGTVVVAVDGACPNNGQRKDLILSAAGVYIGRDSELNYGYPLIDRGATNQRAELQAAIKGVAMAMSPQFEDLHKNKTSILIIQTDSDYVCKGMTSWIDKWKINGWMSAAKSEVANRDLWEELDFAVQDVELCGTKVLFWWVPRHFNKEADGLANEGYASVWGSRPEALLEREYGADIELKCRVAQRFLVLRTG